MLSTRPCTAESCFITSGQLRHWEAVSLLAPARTGNGRRRYRAIDYYRVAAILRAKEAGLALDDIHTMITTSDPAARAATLRRQREDLAQRVADAHTQLNLVEAVLRCQHEDIATRPAFRACSPTGAGPAAR